MILISRAHDWRYTGDGWEWTGKTGTWADLTRRGYSERECVCCGEKQGQPFTSRKPCHRKGEHPNSGFSGILLENGRYAGRRNMRGKHPVTGRPFLQTVER